MNDLVIRNKGSIWLLVAITHAGKDWIGEHIDPDAQTWCDAIVVEPRYVTDIVSGATNDGLKVG